MKNEVLTSVVGVCFLLLLVACVWFGLVSFCFVLFLFRSFFCFV